jgi:glutamate-1-semialdehyde 2,1-aminomutase
MGNGFPVAAIAGKDHVIQDWAGGGVMQAGTYSGNAVGVAATSATLQILGTGQPYAAMEKTGTALMSGIEGILAEEGVPGHVVGHWSMFSVFLGDDPPRDFRGTAAHDSDMYRKVILGMITRGVFPCDDALEPWFISAAHSAEDVAQTLEAFGDSLADATR